jgi:uncharacterized protein (TIGR02145 family)
MTFSYIKNKSVLITILLIIIGIRSEAQISGTFTDKRDGKVYKTVKIGSQTWMAENLAFKTGKGYWAFREDTNNAKTYGFLYDWETAKIACPKGWHIPSDEEWTVLIKYLGGDDLAGGMLKEAGTTHWLKPNVGATDSVGFNALPGGNHYNNGKFYDLRLYGRWWTSTELTTTSAWYCYMYYDNTSIKGSSSNKLNGFSVRCLKD